MEKTTEIKELKNIKDNTTTTLINLDIDRLKEFFFDGDNEIKDRTNCFYYIQEKDLDSAIEITHKIISMFSFSKTNIFKMLLKSLVTNNKIDLNIKYQCCNSIYNFNKNEGYEMYLNLIKNNENNPTLSNTLKIDILRYLLETETYYKETLELFINFMFDKKLECDYRYKTLISIQKDTERFFVEKYIIQIYLSLVKSNDIFTRYRILSTQYILQNKNIDKNIKDEVENICLSFAKDDLLDYNLRADASDLLIRLGNENSKKISREIISLLGRNSDKYTTVYSNKQNVHDSDIDNSIKKIILKISSIITKESDNVDFSSISKSIINISKNNNLDKINSSLLRIKVDQYIYEGGQTLQSIFIKIWNIICKHEHSDELKKRMVEELIDMADTCSSGHISRIINVLCGYTINGENINIEIGYDKQIKSNFLAKINLLIKNIEDSELQFNILEQLSDSKSLEEKPELNSFFRKNLFKIRDEMYVDYVDGKYVTNEEFEEYFRNAIYFFEIGK